MNVGDPCKSCGSEIDPATAPLMIMVTVARPTPDKQQAVTDDGIFCGFACLKLWLQKQ